MARYKIIRKNRRLITVSGKKIQDTTTETTLTGICCLDAAELSVIAYELNFVKLNVIEHPVKGTATQFTDRPTFNSIKELGYATSTVCNLYGECVLEVNTLSQTIERYE